MGVLRAYKYCRHFMQRGDPDEDKYGECRRMPPQSTGPNSGYWPLVNYCDWCGEFLSRGSRPANQNAMEEIK